MVDKKYRKSSLIEFELDKLRVESLYYDLIPKVPKNDKVAKLILPDGKEIELPILEGTCGPPMIDIRNLYIKTGYFTFDPGYTCTGACASQITFIDGEKGKLLYRGHRIQDICTNNDFIDTCYLLLYGELPSTKDKEKFESTLKAEMVIHEKLTNFYKGFESNAHPMAIMVGVVGALSAFFNDDLDISNPLDRELAAIRIVAKMPMIAALAFRTSMGLPIVYPKKELSFSENFLYMLYKDPIDDDYKIDPYLAKVLDTLLILQADHEQNASAATVRIAGSSLANPYACVAAGISSLWGPLHGGANEAVLRMLEEIKTVENIPAYIKAVKEKKKVLFGFGHRVYKSYDPRAKIVKKLSDEVFAVLGKEPLIELAIELEKIALTDKYFIDKKLYPNVDFYTGVIYKAMGFPTDMFPVLFSIPRVAGWLAHWVEFNNDSENKIVRPRQNYLGLRNQNYVDIEKRSEKGSELEAVESHFFNRRRASLNKKN